ncbi:MAG: hypothetical protein ABI746_07660 [Dermatophilaceae bacterium]
MSWVVTADQVKSRTGRDRVPDALEELQTVSTTRAFERTAGDEIQAVLARGADVVGALRVLVRLGDWRVGIGGGAVETPLPVSTRAGRGPAFVAAREALSAARRAPGGIAVRVCPGGRVVSGPGYRRGQRDEAADAADASDGGGAADAETMLWLLADLWRRRSPEGWEVVELFTAGQNGQQSARSLDISPSAVSQRASAARWVEGRRAEELAARLVDGALSARTDGQAGA